MRPSSSNVSGCMLLKAECCDINNMAVRFRLVTNLRLRDVCVADESYFVNSLLHIHLHAIPCQL